MAASSPRKRTTTPRTTKTTPTAKAAAGAARPPAKSKAAARPKRDTGTKLQGLNLRSLQRETEVKDPYPFHLDGEQFYIEDPSELEWQAVVSTDPRDAVKVLRAWMGAEDFMRFAGLPLKVWEMLQLQKEIADYFGLDLSQGSDGGRGEEPALPRS